MKLRHLFVSILAAAGLLMTSCQEKEKDLGLPEIKITQNELALDQNVNSVNLNVYATRNWTVSTAADWISVNPSKGTAYQETAVTVTVLENAGYNRVGTVKFDIGYDSKTLTINQTGAQGEKSEGSGTVDDPYTVAGVLTFIQTLGTETSENAVYIKGKVAAVTLTYEASGTYGNARFTMVDEGSTDPFTAYNVLYLGNKKWSAGQTDIKEGDEVIVCSKVFNYGGKTPETASGGYLYSLNGETAGGGGSGDEAKGTGTLDDPYNPAGAAAAVASLTWTSTTEYQTTDEVYVKGKISKIADKGTYTDGGTYGNATFYITETGESTGTEFYVYRILYLGNKKYESGKTDIKVGDEVIIYGKLMNYRGNTPETASGCYLYSLNGDTGTGGGGGGSDEAKGTGTLTDPYNPAGAVNAVKNLTWTSNSEYQTTDEVYVKGKISKIADKGTYTDGGTYGNATFYITETGESTGTEFYVYRILYLGNKKYESGQTDIKVGDEVVIYGKLMNYRGNTPETASGAYLYSLNGVTENTGGGGGGGGTTDETYFTETFETSQGNFTIDNKTMPTELTYVWKHDATNKYMKASAYANSTKYATESWLISPEIDLSSAPSAFLSFDHVMRYFGTANQEGTLKVTIDNGANWADVTIPTYPDGTSWTFVSSGEISLASYVGKKIKLAFIYKSSTDAAATWEIKNVKVYKTSTAGGGDQGGGGGTGGGDTGSGITVGLAATSFTADTDATYGAGFKYTSSEGIVIAYYKYNSTTALVNTQSDHIRVYKNAVIVVTAPAGKTIKNLVFNCTYADKTYQMNVLEGGGSTTADTTAKTVTWSGSASKFVGNTVNGQCQFKNVVVTLE
ncbi:MAG: BACON domain-containing protein [Bacteroidales bacterium]|nr:BACON domain-containing protein [Bacteroidales bacterium]